MAKRTYNLTRAGRAVLQASARRIPRTAQTGPRTPLGKLRSSMNALRVGGRGSAHFQSFDREIRALRHEMAVLERELEARARRIVEVMKERKAFCDRLRFVGVPAKHIPDLPRRTYRYQGRGGSRVEVR